MKKCTCFWCTGSRKPLSKEVQNSLYKYSDPTLGCTGKYMPLTPEEREEINKAIISLEDALQETKKLILEIKKIIGNKRYKYLLNMYYNNKDAKTLDK